MAPRSSWIAMAVERSSGVVRIVWMSAVEAIFNIALLLVRLVVSLILLWDHHIVLSQRNHISVRHPLAAGLDILLSLVSGVAAVNQLKQEAGGRWARMMLMML